MFLGSCLTLIPVLATQGCYYAQAIGGQMGVLWGRVPISEALADNDTLSEQERALLAEVPDILAFAREQVGLETGGSYETFYDTGDGPISWNVTACAKTSFTPHLWWFPFVGSAPYKGYFDEEDARSEAEALAARGLDVRVSEVPAYSTLGWFDDPVFRSMLPRGRHALASTLIHESLHATIFRPGAAAFNESLATFVGEEGAIDYLRAGYGEQSVEVVAALATGRDRRRFEVFVHDLYRRLDAFYKRDDLDEQAKLAGREALFEDARRRYTREVVPTLETRAYAGFARIDIDNCLLMAFRTYNTDLDAFAQVHLLTGRRWPQTLAIFRAAAEADDPLAFLARWRYDRWMERLNALSHAVATSAP